MDELTVIILIEEVVFDLNTLEDTLAICSSSACFYDSEIYPCSGRIESARLTLLRLF